MEQSGSLDVVEQFGRLLKIDFLAMHACRAVRIGQTCCKIYPLQKPSHRILPQKVIYGSLHLNMTIGEVLLAFVSTLWLRNCRCRSGCGQMQTGCSSAWARPMRCSRIPRLGASWMLTWRLRRAVPPHQHMAAAYLSLTIPGTAPRTATSNPGKRSSLALFVTELFSCADLNDALKHLH